MPSSSCSLSVHSLTQAAQLPADALLIDAHDEWALAELGRSSSCLDPAVAVIAVARDETAGLRAVRLGADDWVVADDLDELERRLRIWRARRKPVDRSLPLRSSRFPQRSPQELQATQEASLRTVGLLLERRDLETKGHTDRVVRLSERFARYVGLDQRQLQALRWGAYLHDIGKIALPDRILFKPGPLDSDEWELVRQHVTVGFEMVESLPFLPHEARELIRYHHERWDGSGYPQRLQGEEIPLLARLFGLVDVYDALLSRRPYKPAWPAQLALESVEAGAGKAFDPDLAEQFVAMIGVRA